MLKEFNKLNSKLNTLLNPVAYFDKEWYNSFAIISFNPNIKPEKPRFEYLVRSEYTESDIEDAMTSDYDIKNVIEKRSTNTVYFIERNQTDDGFECVEKTIVNTDNFIAGPFFTLSEANEVLSILSTIY